MVFLRFESQIPVAQWRPFSAFFLFSGTCPFKVKPKADAFVSHGYWASEWLQLDYTSFLGVRLQRFPPAGGSPFVMDFQEGL